MPGLRVAAAIMSRLCLLFLSCFLTSCTNAEPSAAISLDVASITSITYRVTISGDHYENAFQFHLSQALDMGVEITPELKIRMSQWAKESAVSSCASQIANEVGTDERDIFGYPEFNGLPWFYVELPSNFKPSDKLYQMCDLTPDPR